MLTGSTTTHGPTDPVADADAPVGWLVAIGAGLGLLAALLLMADWPLLMSAGAVIGLLTALAIDIRRTES
jgi:hypothetical protein